MNLERLKIESGVPLPKRTQSGGYSRKSKWQLWFAHYFLPGCSVVVDRSGLNNIRAAASIMGAGITYKKLGHPRKRPWRADDNPAERIPFFRVWRLD